MDGKREYDSIVWYRQCSK